jgi:hypothetical protein
MYIKKLLFLLILVLAARITTADTKFAEIPKSSDILFEWEFTSMGEDQYGTPTTAVSIKINGVKFEIANEIGSFYEIPSSDFKTYRLPKAALTACQGWWAGAGCQYWLVDGGKSYNVMRRDIEEGDAEHSDYLSKPKKVKSIMID